MHFQPTTDQIRKRNNRNLLMFFAALLALLLVAFFMLPSDVEGMEIDCPHGPNCPIIGKDTEREPLCTDTDGNVIYSVSEGDINAPNGIRMIMPHGKLTFPPNTPDHVKQLVVNTVTQQVYESYLHTQGRIEELIAQQAARMNPDGLLSMRMCRECSMCVNKQTSIAGGENFSYDCYACGCPRACNARVYCGCPENPCPQCGACYGYGDDGVLDNPIPPGVPEDTPHKPRQKLTGE